MTLLDIFRISQFQTPGNFHFHIRNIRCLVAFLPLTQAYQHTVISTALHSVKHMHLENFSITSTIFIKILSLLWRRKVMESKCFLAYVYWPIPTLQLSPSNKLQGQCISYLFNRAYSIITNKDYLYIENLEWSKC